MLTMRRLFLISIVWLWHLPASAATTSAVPLSDNNIHIYADNMSQNRTDDTYVAEGNVTVQWQGQNLAADKVRYAAPSHLLYATGSVVLSKGTYVLKGEALVLDTNTGRAEMDSTLLTVPGSGMTLSAEKLTRINESEFDAASTELTTCKLPDPDWKFAADNVKVNLLGYATGRNVIFYVNDVPVLYLPWMAFPVVLEKRSGLLFPRAGYSKSRGFQLDIPAYWVISPNQDLQLDLDVMSRRGAGTGLDYRYIRKRGSEGHLNPYQIYDQLEERWRWQLTLEHKEILSTDANVRITVNTSGDRRFLSDFGEKNGDYNRQFSNTTINALKTWQNYAVTSYVRYNEDLYAIDNQATLQTLPSFGVAAVRQPVFSLPLYLDVDGSAENLYRESPTSGQRLYAFPRITLLPFRSGILQVGAFAGMHIRGYATDRQDENSNIKNNSGIIVPETGGRLSTSLTRIYYTGFTVLKKIRHEIIPEISYSFVPERDQQQLPLYDYIDRINLRNMVSLSVTNLISGKFVSGDAAEYRDISRIKLSADYKFEGERRDLLTLAENQRPWSNLSLESDTWLTRILRLTFDTGYNMQESRLATAMAGIELDDRQGNSLGAGYQMAHREVEYFEGRLSTRLVKPVNLTYTARYSFDRSDFLESIYAAEYRQKCWSLNLAIHQRPGNQFYTFSFNLAGLGSR